MCRLCVFRRDMSCKTAVVIDAEVGYNVELDATTCPQCRQRGAFQEDHLKQLLPLEVVQAEMENARREREQREAARARETKARIQAFAIRRLKKFYFLWG